MRHVNHKRVPQCALSRICGMCGETLGRPIAFVGTQLEVDRNAFHFPPLHTDCAELALQWYADLPPNALGIGARELLGEAMGEAHEEWFIVHTSGFEYLRPSAEQARPASRLRAQLTDAASGLQRPLTAGPPTV